MHHKILILNHDGRWFFKNFRNNFRSNNLTENSNIVVDVLPLIAYHGVTRDSMFGLQRMRNSTVNARDSQFILVQALDCDRVIALRPVDVSLCVGLMVLYNYLKVAVPMIPALLYIVRRSES